MQVIASSAQRLIDIVHESIKLAESSGNPDTKLSRLGVAHEKLFELRIMVSRFPFLSVTNLDLVEAQIAAIQQEFLQSGLKELADGNLAADALEKQGRAEEAIAIYEALLKRDADTPFTYRRLAILYRKRHDTDNELRVLRAAITSVPRQNAQHWAWFDDRLKKRVAEIGKAKVKTDRGSP